MEVLTVLQLVIDRSFEVKGFDQGRLMQDQRVSHAVDVDAFGRHPDTQLWYAEKNNPHTDQKHDLKIINI